MGVPEQRDWLSVALVLIGITAAIGTGAAVIDGQPQQVASCTASPTLVQPGENVTLDASASDASFVEFDKEGDGTYEKGDETDFIVTVSYAESGTYGPVARADGEDTDPCGTVEVTEFPTAELSVSPTQAVTGESVTFDASGSFDPDGSIVEYRWDYDGDGTVDNTTSSAVTTHTYQQTGTYVARVTVVDDQGATDTAERDLVVEEGNQPPQPELLVSPRPGVVGQPVSFDASGSTDPDGTIVEYRWDFDGDGTVDNTTSSAVITNTYQQAGSYVPTVTVVDDDDASRPAETNLRVRERDSVLRCTVEPTQVTPGEEVFIDASGSTNVELVDYDIDGDGEYERLERTELTTVVMYEEPGNYTPRVRYRRGEQVEECGTVTVEEPNEPPTARFTVGTRQLTPGETVTFDASASSDPDGRVVTYIWDFDGDGTVDRRTNSSQVQTSYASTGGFAPRLTVVDDDGARDTTQRDLVVEPAPTDVTTTTTTPTPPDDEEGGIPIIPIGGGLLGLGGLLWYFFGGGGGAPGGGQTPTPKPKPTPGSSDAIRYETGVFALPPSSGSVSVPIGFEPDLVLCSVINGARTDPAIDRTAGGSFGLAHSAGDEVTNQCLTVADDAQSTDQATCAVTDSAVLQLVRHESDSPPGRVTGRVSSTSSSGFTLDVTIPGDDPLAGGVRVLYQAFRTTSAVDVETGFFRTPTEPGTQTVDLGIDADHVSLTAAAAVTDTDQLWTTNRGVGLTVGNAVAADGSLDQTVWGTSAWPEREHTTAAVCRTDRALHLVYQDADRIAGRTSASVTDLGTTLRLLYDRVYNGPHKLGSTARHPVSYLAMDGGEKMRPAIGTVAFPAAGESVAVDCGFEPEMVELVVSAAPEGEEVSTGAAARPFDISHGTAIDTGDGLRQYVVHHSVVAEPPAARTDVSVPGAATAGTDQAAADGGEGAATDGGQSPGRSPADQPAGDQGGTVPPSTKQGTGVPETDIPQSDVPQAGAPEADVPETGPAGTDAAAGDEITAPDPTETQDDGRAGLWLPQAPDGTVIGRDELRVTALTDTGFDVAVESVSTDGRSGGESRPTVVYRAWPTVDGGQDGSSERASSDTTGDSSPAGTSEQGDSTTRSN